MKGWQATWAATVAAGILSLLAAPTQAEIVKWVDDKGVTHYGEKAPDGTKTTKVKVSDTTSSDADAEIEKLNQTRAAAKAARDPDNEDDDGKDKGKKPATPPAKGLADENAKACEQHRKNIATMKSGKRVRVLDDKGNRRALSAEELQTQIEFTESELKRCEQIQKLKGPAPAATGAPATP